MYECWCVCWPRWFLTQFNLNQTITSCFYFVNTHRWNFSNNWGESKMASPFIPHWPSKWWSHSVDRGEIMSPSLSSKHAASGVKGRAGWGRSRWMGIWHQMSEEPAAISKQPYPSPCSLTCESWWSPVGRHPQTAWCVSLTCSGGQSPPAGRWCRGLRLDWESWGKKKGREGEV